MAHLIKAHARNVFGPEHIYVTRHGQSQGQLDVDQYRICGDDNIPLTDLGHIQAVHAGELLRAFNIHVAALYHSTSLRALQTGEGILLALPYTPHIVPDKRIDKQKFGQFDGLFTDAEREAACPEAFARYQEELKIDGPLAARPPGGESILDVIDRVGVEMDEILENVFENQFILKREYPIGNYTIRFSAEGFDGKLKQVALTTFYFLNGQDNLPPVISNSVIEPDTVIVNDTTVIFTSIEAMDPNGKSDLLEVYFKVYKPDGSTNNFKWLLLDDGSCCPLPPFNQVSGDVTANDGIYSRKIEVNQGNDKGTYRFEFQARDRSGEISNIINHFVLIQ